MASSELDVDECQQSQACDALVLGAGAAGVAAARELTKLGLKRVIVLEAEPRGAGGRAHSSDELGCGVPLDHGAQWIHGYSKTHPMALLATGAGVKKRLMVSGGRELRHCDGALAVDSDMQAAADVFSQLQPLVESEHPARDCSWAEALIRAYTVANPAATPVATPAEAISRLVRAGTDDDAIAARRCALVNDHIYHQYENYEGARLDRWSTRNGLKADCLPGPNADVDGGYGNLIAGLADGIDLRAGRRVTLLDYQSPDGAKGDAVSVKVHCTVAETNAEEVYSAPRCIVTFPLGVLRSGLVKFQPSLPQQKVDSMSALGIALMDKVELLWERRWWPAGVGSIHIASRDSSPTYHPWPWFLEATAAKQHPLGWAVLVCFITGKFAEEVEALDDEAAVADCVEALQRVFPETTVPSVSAAHITRWGQNPYSCGSWTYYAVGSGPADAKVLAEPVGDRGCVAFAGEHTCDGSKKGLDIGTVHGAWLSGVTAARGLLSRIDKTSFPVSVES